MVAEIHADDVFALSTSQTNAAKKADTVEVSKSLPAGGKELPVSEHKTNSLTNNIDDAVRELNEHVQLMQSELQFSVDKDSGKTVIKVIDMKTQELVRQIPSEEAIKVAQRLTESSNLEIFDSYT